MSVDADAESLDAEPHPPERQLACPTQTDRDPQPIDVDDPRTSADRLCDHCFQDDKIPADVDHLLKLGRYDKGIHLPLSYDGEKCKFGPYDDYRDYKTLLDKMSVEEFDAVVNGELTLEEVKRRLDLVSGGDA